MFGRRFLMLMVFMMPIVGFCQQNDLLSDLLKTATATDEVETRERVMNFIADLDSKRVKFKSDEKFIHYLFTHTHKEFLHQYQTLSQFPEMFKTGKYDCLSATSLFSVILKHFNYDFKIIETNYHIFIVLETQHGRILLETTDMFNGVITNEVAITERIDQYHQNNITYNPEMPGSYYHYSIDLFEEVSANQLTGLLWFNQAVKSLNKNDYAACADELKKALRVYYSPRINEIVLLLVNNILNSELSSEEQKDLIRPFAAIVKENFRPSASR